MNASSRRPGKRSRRVSNDSGWLLAGVIVYFGIAVSGVWVAGLSQDVRSAFVALETDQRDQDRLLAQYSRLLLERGTLASYQSVDELAEQTLGMSFPEQVERIPR